MTSTTTITTQSDYAVRSRMAASGLGAGIAAGMIAAAREHAGRDIVTVPFVHRVTFTPGAHAAAGYVGAHYTAEVPAATAAYWAVGDGASVKLYTDSHAYTVIKVTAKTITIQRDIATADPNWKPDFTPGGFMGHTANDRERTYTYAPDPTGATLVVRLTKRGWSTGGQVVTPGRHEFYDSNF